MVGVRHFAALLALLVVAACAVPTKTALPQRADPQPLAIAAGAEPTERDAFDAAPSASAPIPAAQSPAVPSPALSNDIIRGTGSFVGEPTPTRTKHSTPEAGATLNFVNADVRDVAKAVLADLLKLNYVVAGNVQGTVTVQTSQPLDEAQILPAFEQALRLSGLALVRSAGFYKIMPLADAQKEATINPIAPPAKQPAGPVGFAVEVVPLKFVGAAEMQKLLEPLVPSPGALRADPARNIIFVQGTQSERNALRADIALFDVDWLAGMSFALFTPRYVEAGILAKEMREILGGQTGPIVDLVRFVTIDRLNAVLAISPQPTYLEELRRWVERLDKAGEGTDQRLMVYYVQNGRASDLASVLIRALSGGGIASSRGEAATGIPPPLAPPAIAPSLEGVSVSGLGRIRITADDTKNALVILATPQEYEAIRAALRELDTEPLQVMIEAAIAEVTLTDDLRYGVQYFYRSDSKRDFVLSNSASTAIARNLPGFSHFFTDGADIKIILDALASVTRIEVLSSPQILVLNNEVANLQVGNRIPTITQQAVSTADSNAPIVNSVQYQETGVILKVTPRVNQGGMVLMDIAQEVSDVTQTTTSTIDSPTIQQRKINSSIAVKDGETVALGGLITNKRTRGKSGIPILQSVPILGAAFRSTTRALDRTELLVLITPHVINNSEKARAVSQELRDKLFSVTPLVTPRRPRVNLKPLNPQ